MTHAYCPECCQVVDCQVTPEGFEECERCGFGIDCVECDHTMHKAHEYIAAVVAHILDELPAGTRVGALDKGRDLVGGVLGAAGYRKWDRVVAQLRGERG